MSSPADPIGLDCNASESDILAALALASLMGIEYLTALAMVEATNARAA